MKKKKKTGYIKQTKHKKQTRRRRQASQKKPVSQGKQPQQIQSTRQTKQTSQKKQTDQGKTTGQGGQISQAKQVSQAKASGQAKSTSQKKLSGQAKSTVQEKLTSQTKQTDQTKHMSQAKPASQGETVDQDKQISQINQENQTRPAGRTNRSSMSGQDKQTGQLQQKKSSVRQRDNNTQRRGQRTGQRQNATGASGRWKEVLYNCPYVLGIVLTSLFMMLWSDEIGFKAVAGEAQTVMAQVGKAGEYIKLPLWNADKALSGETLGNGDEETAVMENNSGNNGQEDENAGLRKYNIDGKETENYSGNETGIEENIENTDDVAKSAKGITRFEIYEPQEIDSRYYSDAGKVALTTEYPYSKENIGYFSDAAFLGDSRTLGISDYAGLDQTDFYCDSGMMIFKLLEDEVTYQKTGDKVDLTQVLQEKQYGKIYIMLGMNELGYGNTGTYLEQYRKVVDQIREWQPQAIIYIMANLHVSREKNNMETEFNNININDKNAASAQLANGTDIFYLDVNPLFTDQDGFLNAELTFDGVHLYAQHYDKWREFLLEHAVVPIEQQ